MFSLLLSNKVAINQKNPLPRGLIMLRGLQTVGVAVTEKETEMEMWGRAGVFRSTYSFNEQPPRELDFIWF